MSASSDRNLLFGILALQMDFIARDQLIGAMHAWVLVKDRPLAEHLVDAGALEAEHRALLEPLVEAHIRQHRGDAQQSLAAISSVEPVLRDALAAIGDPDLMASLKEAAPHGLSPHGPDPHATLPFAGAGEMPSTRFRILRPHAEGGLGRVYVACDEELGREVALKEMKAQHALHEESRLRFTREAEITGWLEHPGIVPIYGLGAYPDGRPFYAMRFVRGHSLKEAIDEFHHPPAGQPADTAERRLALRRLLQRFIDVCEAIDYAHSRGVLHRDLKPGNIMLGRHGETLVVDWGLAKAMGRPDIPAAAEETSWQPRSGSTPTEAGSRIGTPAYMSPEQAAGRIDQIGAASDVYNLGATLYHLLTGRPPVVEGEPSELLRKIEQGRIKRLREVNAAIEKPLAAIVERAMALDPALRYPSPAELGRDLEQWLADEPVSALPDCRSERIARWSRHHRPVVRAAVVMTAVLAIISTAAALAVNHSRGQALKLAQENAELAAKEHNERTAAEALAREKAILADREREAQLVARRRTARALFEQGHALCAGGNVPSGVHWLVRALREAQVVQDGDLEHSIRLQLGAWSAGMEQVAARLPHKERPWLALFHPSGKKLLTAASEDAVHARNTVYLWNLATGGSTSRYIGALDRAEFSPDGKHLVLRNKIYQVNGDTIEELRSVPGDAIAWTPDGRLAVAVSSNSLSLFETDAWTRIGATVPLSGLFTYKLSVAVSPDGRTVAIGGGVIQVWDIESEPKLKKTLDPREIVTSLTFSPDSQLLVGSMTAEAGATVFAWDFNSDEKPRHPLRNQYLDAQVRATGNQLVVTSADLFAGVIGSIHVCELETFRTVAGPYFTQGMGDYWVDGHLLATIGLENEVRVTRWSSERKRNELEYEATVNAIAFSPDGSRLLVGSGKKPAGGQAHLHDLSQGKPEWTVKRISPVRGVAYGDEGRLAIGSGASIELYSPDGTPVRVTMRPQTTAKDSAPQRPTPPDTMRALGNALWRAFGGTMKRDSIPRPARTSTFSYAAGGTVASLALSPDGKWLVSASNSGGFLGTTGQAMLRDLSKLPATTVVDDARHAGQQVACVTIDPAGAFFVSGGYDSTVRIWRSEDGMPERPPLMHDAPVTAVALSKAGDLLASGTLLGSIRCFRLADGSQVGTVIRRPGAILSLAFSPDGKTLLVGGEDKIAVQYDLHTGRSIGPELRHDDAVTAVAFRPDGQAMASGGRDRKVRLWNAQQLSGVPEELERWAQIATAQSLDERGLLQPIPVDRWNELSRIPPRSPDP